jgi:hypothetical protein
MWWAQQKRDSCHALIKLNLSHGHCSLRRISQWWWVRDRRESCSPRRTLPGKTDRRSCICARNLEVLTCHKKVSSLSRNIDGWACDTLMRDSNVPPASSLSRGCGWYRFGIVTDRFRNVQSLSAGYSPYKYSPLSSHPSPVPLHRYGTDPN